MKKKNTKQRAQTKRKVHSAFRNKRPSENKPQAHTGGKQDSKSDSSSCTIIDKMTGEVRSGGAGMMEAYFRQLKAERDMFMSSPNKEYLTQRIAQNDVWFDREEIERMVDATFICASHGSPDAWYPNQYALGLAFEHPDYVPAQVAYFVSNFELGLRLSAQRRSKQLGVELDLSESDHLTTRLSSTESFRQLTANDFTAIADYVRMHPLYDDCMSWYETISGKEMNKGGSCRFNAD